MGRGSENLPLARASRSSAAGATRRAPRLADYTGGRLSFGNERAAPLVFPWRRSRAARAVNDTRCGSPHGIVARKRVPSGGRVACVASGDHQLDHARLMEQLAALDDGEAGTVENVADAILHDLLQLASENPEVGRVSVATPGTELVALGDSLRQRVQRGQPKRTLEGELREQAMMGHGNLRVAVIGDVSGRGAERRVTGPRQRPACRAAGEPNCAANWGDR